MSRSALDDALTKLQALYREVDGLCEKLAELNAARLRCRRACTTCCTDGITVFEIEAENIRRHTGTLLQSAPMTEDACAFLDATGACRIYAQRPYVCRTQGLPFRWLDEQPDGGLMELRDICPLNEAGPPLEELPEERCWTIGEYEGRLAELQRSVSKKELQRDARSGELQRVALRALFE